MAEQDILDLVRDSNDSNVYIYDPRARYHKRSRSRRRMTYDPQPRRRRRAFIQRVRRVGRRLRPHRATPKNWAKKVFSINGGLFAAGFAIGAIGASTAGDRNWINTGQPTGTGRIKYTIWDAVLRLTFGYVNIGGAMGIPANVLPPGGPGGFVAGWNWNKFFSSKYMWGGIGLWILSMVSGVPQRGKLRRFAQGLTFGGGYGGGTDPSAATTAPMRTIGPQITRPSQAGLGPRATYTVGPVAVPTYLNGGLQP
jgi:hypothetical protein